MSELTLSAIPYINVTIKTARSDTIKLVHKFIFGKDDSRLNRKNLRNFSGFPFQIEDANFVQKCDSVLADFSKLQLLRIANFFN